MIPFFSSSRALLIFCALFFVDRATKMIALFLFSEHPFGVIPQLLRFSLYLHTRNFFIGQPTTAWTIEALLIFFCIAFFFFFRQERKTQTVWIAVILAGVLDNVFDSIRYGSIIDWIEIPNLTFFNIADCAIVVGCSVLCWKFFSSNRRRDIPVSRY